MITLLLIILMVASVLFLVGVNQSAKARLAREKQPVVTEKIDTTNMPEWLANFQERRARR